MLFDPSKTQADKKSEQALLRKASKDIQKWAMSLLPEVVQTAKPEDPHSCLITVREVQCGDPNCAPIDTTIQMLFKNGRNGSCSVPKRMFEVTHDDVMDAFPDEDRLMAWAEGRPETPPLSPAAESAVLRLTQDIVGELDRLIPTDQLAVCDQLMEYVRELEIQAEERLKRQSSIRQSSENPQHVRILSATQQNDATAVQQLIESGVSPSFANGVGQTPLHIAALWGNMEACAVLLAAGADTTATNTLSGATPLHMAAMSAKPYEGRLKCVEMIVRAGADLSVQDFEGQTAWQAHASKRSAEPELASLITPPQDDAPRAALPGLPATAS